VVTEDLFQNLNELFQNRARLGIMTYLLTLGESSFTTLKQKLSLTDGNLSAHLRTLEEAGYLEVEKGFAGRKPRTLYRVTILGKEAFLAYLSRLEDVIRMVNPEN